MSVPTTIQRILFPLLFASLPAKAFDYIYGLRNDEQAKRLPFLDAEARQQQGITQVMERALIFVAGPTPGWIEGPVYHHETEFDAWHFATGLNAMDAIFAVTVGTKGISVGEVSQAQLLEETVNPNSVGRSYRFNNTQIGVTYRFQSNCSDESISYPALATLKIQIGNNTLLELQGYHDDIDTSVDGQSSAKIDCEQFIESNRNRMTYTVLEFLGDLNRDGLIDAVITHTEKFGYERNVYLGKLTNGALMFETFEADSYAPQ